MELERAEHVARSLGLSVYVIERDFDRCGDANGALAHVPVQPEPVKAIWLGSIPSRERYEAIYKAARARSILLINTPTEFWRAMWFWGFYPRLAGLTPESILIEGKGDCRAAAAQLGLPLFLKGSVKSMKEVGLDGCLVRSLTEFEIRVEALLRQPAWAFGPGPVVARKLVPLRHCRKSPEGFPFGREYRVFILRGRIIACGYYWEGDDELQALSSEERGSVESLALVAGRRLEVPYVAIDIGQSESGEWLVIETADAQFCGAGHVARLELWTQLVQHV